MIRVIENVIYLIREYNKIICGCIWYCFWNILFYGYNFYVIDFIILFLEIIVF